MGSKMLLFNPYYDRHWNFKKSWSLNALSLFMRRGSYLVLVRGGCRSGKTILHISLACGVRSSTPGTCSSRTLNQELRMEMMRYREVFNIQWHYDKIVIYDIPGGPGLVALVPFLSRLHFPSSFPETEFPATDI